ncbi:MAG: hypothetical protein ACYC3I_24815 [Gemmataceae bacterium]
MRLRTAFVTIGLCVLASGCQLTWDITRNLAFQTCLNTNAIASKIEYRHMANLALVEYSSHHPEPTQSVDFVKGFKQGYAEYLEYGGSEIPPPAPPVKYWKIKYQNKEGRLATSMWNAGYKEGATAAKASGARNFIVVPFNKIASAESQPAPAFSAPQMGILPPGSVPVLPPGSMPPPERELPLPRPAPKEAAPPPVNTIGAGTSEGPQANLDQLGPGDSDGGQNAEITLTDAPLEPASLGSPRALSPRNR